MELEQRVKTLEYEMKVLKSEIQRTLLDIQEQILVHYYPALRSEQDQVPEAARQAVQAVRATVEQAKPASPPPAPVQEVPPAPAPMPPPAPDPIPAPSAPIVKKVTLDQVRSAQNDPPPGDELSRMSKLLSWSLDADAQIGTDRVSALVQIMGAHKIMSPEVIAVLQRIAPLNRRTATEPVGMREVIQVITQLDAILERPADVEEALSLIEEAKIG